MTVNCPGPDGAVSLSGEPATTLTLHGGHDELTAVLAGLRQRRWTVLHKHGPARCRPKSRCHHMRLIVAGVFDPDDMDAIGTGFGWTRGDITVHPT